MERQTTLKSESARARDEKAERGQDREKSRQRSRERTKDSSQERDTHIKREVKRESERVRHETSCQGETSNKGVAVQQTY